MRGATRWGVLGFEKAHPRRSPFPRGPRSGGVEAAHCPAQAGHRFEDRVSNAIPCRGSGQGITRISKLSEGASKLSPTQDANEADHIDVWDAEVRALAMDSRPEEPAEVASHRL